MTSIAKIIAFSCFLANSVVHAETLPSETYNQVKELAQTQLNEQIEGLVPPSMHAHYTVGEKFQLELASASESKAVFKATLITSVSLNARIYSYFCFGPVTVQRVPFAMQPAGVVIFEEVVNESQLIAQSNLTCHEIR